MNTTINLLPTTFRARYRAVIEGRVKLDTIPKLKKFWLLAVKQGWQHPTARPAIASAAFDAAHYDSYMELVVYCANADLRYALDKWECYEGTNETPYPGQETDEQYRDRIWGIMEWSVRAIH